jgi:hypothetical protein
VPDRAAAFPGAALEEIAVGHVHAAARTVEQPSGTAAPKRMVDDIGGNWTASRPAKTLPPISPW